MDQSPSEKAEQLGCTHFEDERHRQRELVMCGCAEECCLWPERDAFELERLEAPHIGEYLRVVQSGSPVNGLIGRVAGRYMMWEEDAEETGSAAGVWLTLLIPGRDLRGKHRRRNKAPSAFEWFGSLHSTEVV